MIARELVSRTTIGHWQPYPDYKNSGIEWLGEIPNHWKLMMLKHAARLNPESLPETTKPDYEILYIDIGNVDTEGNILDIQSYLFENAPSRARRVVRHGDTIVSTVRTYLKAIAYIDNPPDNLIVSTGFAVLRPAQTVYPEYMRWLTQSEQFVALVVTNSVGVSYPAINPSTLGSLPILLPSLPEQRAIAAFLDRETTRIDRLIAAKERLIALLQEKRMALISRAVTKGLDPSVTMKDSGVEWLGEIPAHWEVKRLKQITSQVTVGIVVTPSKYYIDNGIPCLRSLNVRENGLTDTDLVFISPESNMLHRKSMIFSGDLVSVRTGQPGTTAVVDERFDGTNCIDLIITRKSPNFSSHFMAFYLNSEAAKIQYKAGSGGAIQQHFNIETAKNLIIALPPKAEQLGISEYLDTVATQHGETIDNTQLSIDLLHEYRMALITAAVTGKIDVSNLEAAARPAKIQMANVHFRRAVFAAEIVTQLHQEPTFGHVKFQKLLFLAENTCKVDIGSQYHRAAAGPYDNRALRSIDKQLQEQKWFEVRKRRPTGYYYAPMAKAGGHREYFNRYYSDIAGDLQRLIDTFRSLDTERCEIVATLYGAWQDLLAEQSVVTDGQIVHEVLHNWHESKQQISEERWYAALKWMRETGLTPASD
jgi:type I restriction enzyme S subunit